MKILYERYGLRKSGEVFNILTGKVLKPFANKKGYFMVKLYFYGGSKTCQVHRLVALTFIPNPENKPTVNHLDGDKRNNNDWNLEWATHAENIQHAIKTGLRTPSNGAVGRPAVPVAVYDLAQNKLSEHLTINDAVRLYNVSQGNVLQVIQGKRTQTKGLIFKKIMKEQDDDVIYDCQEVITQTEKASYVSIDGDEVWVPNSQVKIFKEHGHQKIRMPKWLANDKFPNG